MIVSPARTSKVIGAMDIGTIVIGAIGVGTIVIGAIVVRAAIVVGTIVIGRLGEMCTTAPCRHLPRVPVHR